MLTNCKEMFCCGKFLHKICQEGANSLRTSGNCRRPTIMQNAPDEMEEVTEEMFTGTQTRAEEEWLSRKSQTLEIIEDIFWIPKELVVYTMFAQQLGALYLIAFELDILLLFLLNLENIYRMLTNLNPVIIMRLFGVILHSLELIEKHFILF